MLAIEVGGLRGAKEELRAVGAWTGVGHGEDALAGVIQAEVLVFKLLAVNGLATGSIVVGEIASLAHEVWDNTVKGAVLVAKALLVCAQGSEVFSSLWHNITAQHHDDPSCLLAIQCNVKEDSWAFCSLSNQCVVLF